jgi:NagD protein
MAHRGASLAIAVNTGIGEPQAFAELPVEVRPHLRLEGVDDLLSLLPPAAPPAR